MKPQALLSLHRDMWLIQSCESGLVRELKRGNAPGLSHAGEVITEIAGEKTDNELEVPVSSTFTKIIAPASEEEIDVGATLCPLEIERSRRR